MPAASHIGFFFRPADAAASVSKFPVMLITALIMVVCYYVMGISLRSGVTV